MNNTQDYYQFLRKSRFLEDAPTYFLKIAAELAKRIHLIPDEVLFQKGDPGDSMYVILDGRVRVHDDDLVLNYLTVGHVLGEIAAFGSVERTATITAVEDTSLLKINCKTLLNSLSNQPEFAESLANMLCARESSMADKVSDSSLRVRALEKEFEIGRKIQSYFLPSSLPEEEGWEIDVYFKAAKEVAGDFYDVFKIKSLNCIGLVIGDVCDKGVGAALFMTLFRSLLRASALSADFQSWSTDARVGMTQENEIQARILNSISITNNYIAKTHGGTSMFASIFFALLDPETGRLWYINAGHENPIIFSQDKIKHRLETTGPVVGIFPNAKFDVSSISLAPGDSLLAFTDGITEAVSISGEQYQEDRLLDLLTSSNASTNQLLPNIIKEIQRFTAGVSQFDDNTMLLLHRTDT